jgi:BTB/POZ domain
MRLADLKLLRYVAGDAVTILVGPKRKRYIVHKDLICEKSEYFAKAFNENCFKEGIEKEMYLPEDEPDAFDLFIRWLYNSRLDCKAFCVEGKSSAEIHAPRWALMSTLISLYILTDKVCLEELKNTVMDNFKDIAKTHKFSPFAIIRIYAKGPSGSPLRRLAARKCKHDIQAFGGLIGYSDET